MKHRNGFQAAYKAREPGEGRDHENRPEHVVHRPSRQTDRSSATLLRYIASCSIVEASTTEDEMTNANGYTVATIEQAQTLLLVAMLKGDVAAANAAYAALNRLS
jgi:hypothetical protein